MIELTNKNARLTVHPWRGGSVSHWSIKNSDILYCEESSFAKNELKYKGGIPVMFPIFSTTKRDGGSDICYNGKSISLAQHGLARISKAWRSNQIADNEVVLYLQSNDESRSCFPFEFEFEQHLVLKENSLIIKQKVFNSGNEILPFMAGFHPYFAVSDPINCEVSGIPYGAPYYLQLNTGERNFNAHLEKVLPFGKEEINHHFRIASKNICLHDRMTGRNITVERSAEYPCLTLWSELNNPFVCVEPNSGRRGAMENGEDLIRLGVGESWNGQIEIKVS